MNRINGTTDTQKEKLNNATSPSVAKAANNNNEHIVLIAQTAMGVAKDFDYDSLLEILPLMSEYAAFKSAIDSIHKKLYPLYEKELKIKFESENLYIEEIDEYLDQCKSFGEKLILESDLIKEHQEKYFKKAEKEHQQKSQETRVIEKTHSWKDLKDDF